MHVTRSVVLLFLGVEKNDFLFNFPDVGLEAGDLVLHLSDERAAGRGFNVEEAHIVFDSLQFSAACLKRTDEFVTLASHLTVITLQFRHTLLKTGHALATLTRLVGIVDFIHHLAIFLKNLVLKLERHKTYLLPLRLELLDAAYHLIAVAILGKLLQFGYDGALGVEILVLGSAALAVDALALIEEIIACRGEPLPYGVAHLARHAADLLPFGLKLHNLGSGLLDIVGLLQRLGSLAEGSLLLQDGIEFIARLLEIGGLGSEEIITRLAEPVVKKGV